jgi:hypothetical protein
VTAAIAKRYVKELIATATATDDPAFRAVAHQFGHAPTALNGNYGLDLSYPEKLQPELLASYARTSACWHQWLQLASWEHELLQPAVAVAVAAEGEPAAVGGRPRSPKKRKSTEDHGETRQSAGQLQVKRPRVELPDNIRQALKLVAEFYQSIE